MSGKIFKESNGIDLYVSVLQYKEVHHYLHINGYPWPAEISGYEEDTFYNNTLEGKSRKFTDREGVAKAFAFSKYHAVEHSFVIKVMIMDIGVNPLKAVADYDLTFLMNYWNGEAFHLWFPMDIILREGFYNQVRTVLANPVPGHVFTPVPPFLFA